MATLRTPQNRSRAWPLMAAVSLALTVVALSQAGTAPAVASHDDGVCDTNIPAGWSCAPLVGLPDSGPGVTSPASGEVLYHRSSVDTLWVAVRTLHEGDRFASDAALCLDDDADPFSDPSTGTGNEPHDCGGGNVGGGTVVDGSSGIADASPGEPDGNEQYEIRVANISTDGTADGVEYAEFNNIDGFAYVVYRVNIDGERTQAFFTLSAAPTATPEATQAPTPEATPEPTPEPTPAPTLDPTPEPTPEPTSEPTPEPTPIPTPEPLEPTPAATAPPNSEPTQAAQGPSGGVEPALIGGSSELPPGGFVSRVELAPADETVDYQNDAPEPIGAPAPIVAELPQEAPAAESAELATEPASTHTGSILWLAAVALAWAGTGAVVWAGFKSTARLDETDIPL